MEYRYTAIVLRKKEVGETDRLYTLYTKERGKVRALAKGIRKPAAKLAGQMETLMLAHVIVMNGRGMGKIAGAVSEHAFPHLRKDYDTLLRVLQAFASLERLVDLEEPDQELFSLAEEYLLLADGLAGKEDWTAIRLLTQAFLFQMFARLGYRIETSTCAASGRRLKSGEVHYFSPGAGGVIGREHAHEAPHALPIRENTIKLLRLFLSNRLEACIKIRAEEKDVRELEHVSHRFAQWIAH
ncbi:MAG: DNA repair protein RecO [Candidatus Moranbacteria bacterium RIFCSPHIGHO2_01_FULL_55_24]|nr:MAG: DNA repair protein RecO [Candidatus Moranbacteria bacterium RIFCSPHIGHO2_01_FULL_55_24]